MKKNKITKDNFNWTSGGTWTYTLPIVPGTQWTIPMWHQPTIKDYIEEFKEIIKEIHKDKFFKKIFKFGNSEYTKQEWELAIEIFKKII